MSDNDDIEWRNNRERITYEEGRSVLEAQKSDIDDIDDKALRTVRITAILLGVGATGTRVIKVSNINKSIATVSLISFLLSLIFGVIVYNESNEVIGPKSSYLARLRQNNMSAPWEQDLLVQFEGWIDDNQTIVEFNGYLLIACQLFFILGVAFGTSSLLALGWIEFLILITAVLTVIIVTLGVIRGWMEEL
ncbi:hypothetical protein ACNO8S_14040 [Haloarcula sp. KBTZ06]|uniref:hypothetical protein n=1 Tax=Haloarcula sp. KBTZ06 TaxID=3402682 RepID=UPI003B437C1C